MLVLSLLPHGLSGGYDSFLWLEGIKGESEVSGREGWVDVASVSHGGTRPDDGAGDYSTVGLFKKIDRATPLLIKRVARGTPIPKAIIDFVRGDGDRVRFYRVVLEDVFVQRVNMDSASGVSGSFVEAIELNFVSIEWTYTEFDETGAEVGEHIAYWDREMLTGGDEFSESDPPPDLAGDVFRYRVSLSPVDLEGSVAELTWNSAEGEVYGVYYAPTPEGPYDKRVATVESEGDGTTSTTVDLSGDRGFFIIRKVE